MSTLKLVIGLLLATTLVVFGAQNTQSVSLRFLAWDTPDAPVVLILALAVLAGVLLSWLASVPGRVRSRREHRDLPPRPVEEPPPPPPPASAPTE